MQNESINHVFAENLSALMAAKKMTQAALASKSGVAQKTISNYLNPDQRAKGASGKSPSAKLTEVQMVAAVLDVEPWKLLRPINSTQRAVYEKIEAAYAELMRSDFLPANGKMNVIKTDVAPPTKHKKPAQEAGGRKAA